MQTNIDTQKVETGVISDAYDSTQTYVVGNYCIHDNTLYRCEGETTGEWDSTKWVETQIINELGHSGIPQGGVTGQILAKKTNADNDVEWISNVNVVDGLTSTSATDALSANQGRILNESRIVDVVSNSYGTAYKYGNGLMVCAMRYNVNTTITGAWGNVYISSVLTSKNYPVAFTSTPIYQINVESTSNDGAWIMNTQTASKTKPSNFYLVRGDALTNSATFTINVYAIGNWK